MTDKEKIIDNVKLIATAKSVRKYTKDGCNYSLYCDCKNCKNRSWYDDDYCNNEILHFINSGKTIRVYCERYEPPAMKFKCPECVHNQNNKNNFAKGIIVPSEEQIIIDNVSNFCLVCYYDNKNKELVRIEQYKDGSGDIQTDIESHKYGYNAKIIKPEELIKQLARKTQECEQKDKELLSNEKIINKLMKEVDKLKQECEELKEEVKREIKNTVDMERLAKSYGQDMLTYRQKKQIEIEELRQEYVQLQKKYEALKLENQEGYEIVAELKQECEELKEKYDEIKEDRYNLNMEMYTLDRYRKALEEIEEYIKKYECDNCEDFAFGCGDCGTPKDILDIINRAKGGNE